ncbi:unnamed protein product [Blepharisma stoltei]|uniref:Tetratricopeptide repeat protein n=1 Tax=Blepharisma stoltei TaxID=1481888 RepID=A0AAU9JGY2_9CILI|nr:unnamed protein product [Blepharisma stoltei]
MAHLCFKLGCELEPQIVCCCSSPETYCCEIHLGDHLKLPCRAHAFDFIYVEPCKRTKDAILRFLSREKSKKEKLKKVVLGSFRVNLYSSKKSVEETLSKLNTDLEEINESIAKISNTSKQEAPISDLMLLQPYDDFKIARATIPDDLEHYTSFKYICSLNELQSKRISLLSKPNSAKAEQNFRKNCLLYENHAYGFLFSQAYQGFVNSYHQNASLYLIGESNEKTKLFIYDTENEREDMKDFRYQWKLDKIHCIAQLPNGELFGTYESEKHAFSAFIVDRNYKVRLLPYQKPHGYAVAVYFNRSVYCFGGYDFISSRYDMDLNIWRELTIKRVYDNCCHCIIFNGNILISINFTHNPNYLLLYSIDIDSFSDIPLPFYGNKTNVLVNTEERLYLIEFEGGWIYESKISSYTTWSRVAESNINFNPFLTYCSYNKGGIYISAIDSGSGREYLKFDLDRKVLIEIACYNKHVALKRSDTKLETIKCCDRTYKLSPDEAADYINKGYGLYDLCRRLEKIERYNKKLALNPRDAFKLYSKKGRALYDLDRNEEAIECYNNAIILDPTDDEIYYNKGCALYELGRNDEAIECYDKLLEEKPKKPLRSKRKAKLIETISKTGKILAYFNKANALCDMGKFSDAIVCYDEAIKLFERHAFIWNNKGHALSRLGKYYDAIDCYNEAVWSKATNPLYLCYRASLLNDIGFEVQALEDLRAAYDLIKDNQAGEISIESHEISFEERYKCTIDTLNQDWIELIKKFFELPDNSFISKEEYQEFKNSIKNSVPNENNRGINETVKAQISNIIKRAIQFLELNNSLPGKAIQKIEKNKFSIQECKCYRPFMFQQGI